MNKIRKVTSRFQSIMKNSKGRREIMWKVGWNIILHAELKRVSLSLPFWTPVHETFCLFQSMRAREFYLNSAQNNLKSLAKAQDFSYLRITLPHFPNLGTQTAELGTHF